MRAACVLSVIFLLSVLISCQDTQNELLEMRINHHKQTGFGFIGPRILYSVQIEDEIGGEEWQGTFGIENFEYEWGYTYDIIVEKDYYDEIRLDAPSFRYVLVEVLSKEKVEPGTKFQLILQRTFDDGFTENFWQEDSVSGFTIVGNKRFNCSDLCDELTEEGIPNTVLTVTFEHTGDGDIRLVGLETNEVQ